MARVADYSIIRDAWVVEFDQDTIDFEVPGNIDKGSRSILGFMVQVDNNDDLTLTLRMNGTTVWVKTFPEGDRTMFFQEVIPAGSVIPGKNTFTFESSSSEVHVVELSDIVVWWQANI